MTDAPAPTDRRPWLLRVVRWWLRGAPGEPLPAVRTGVGLFGGWWFALCCGQVAAWSSGTIGALSGATAVFTVAPTVGFGFLFVGLLWVEVLIRGAPWAAWVFLPWLVASWWGVTIARPGPGVRVLACTWATRLAVLGAVPLGFAPMPAGAWSVAACLAVWLLAWCGLLVAWGDRLGSRALRVAGRAGWVHAGVTLVIALMTWRVGGAPPGVLAWLWLGGVVQVAAFLWLAVLVMRQWSGPRVLRWTRGLESRGACPAWWWRVAFAPDPTPQTP